jgi:hypothetical protein
MVREFHWREHQMAQKTKKVRRTKGRSKRTTQVTTKASKAPKAPKVPKPAAAGVRSEAARRAAEGKFTKAIFAQIGGKECPRFAPMTWKERDAFMSKPENAAVRDRYEKHLESVESKA